MYGGVPLVASTLPTRGASSPSACARPKSVSRKPLRPPARFSPSTVAGLRARCTNPRASQPPAASSAPHRPQKAEKERPQALPVLGPPAFVEGPAVGELHHQVGAA